MEVWNNEASWGKNMLDAIPQASVDDTDKNSIEEQKALRYKQTTKQRNVLANWVMWVVSVWLGLVLLILYLCGFGVTEMPSSVLISLLATTTANVLGLAYIILKGLFGK